jgi:hypothetical protein
MPLRASRQKPASHRLAKGLTLCTGMAYQRKHDRRLDAEHVLWRHCTRCAGQHSSRRHFFAQRLTQNLSARSQLQRARLRFGSRVLPECREGSCDPIRFPG